MEQKTQTRVKLKNVRLSYVNLLTPNSFEGQNDPKFRCDVLIRKDDETNVTLVREAIASAIENAKAGKGCFAGEDLKKAKAVGKWHSALKDGDVEKPDDPAYKGCYFISPWKKADDAPQVVDIKGTLITKDTPNASDMVYSGVYAHITVSFFAYKNLGNYGTGCYLGNVLTLENGERLAGGKKAEDDFGDDFEDAKNDSSALLEEDDGLL